ncbi:MAG TPA: DUF2269 family protein [Acidimicrobiales bacterium]|jgi:uncharacterized membrane protein
MVLAAINDDFYKALLVLHIVLVIVGFGGVLLNGVYGAQAKKRGGAEGLAITEVNFFVSTKIAEICIYLVPLVGFALVGASDGAWTFSQTWVWLAILLYVAALGFTHSMILPSVKRLIVLQKELVGGPPPAGPPPQAAEMEACGKRLAMASSINQVLLLVIIILMVFKPGV